MTEELETVSWDNVGGLSLTPKQIEEIGTLISALNHLNHKGANVRLSYSLDVNYD